MNDNFIVSSNGDINIPHLSTYLYIRINQHSRSVHKYIDEYSI